VLIDAAAGVTPFNVIDQLGNFLVDENGNNVVYD
jgi:hypothetical protein